MATAASKTKYAYAPSRVYSYSSAALAEALPEYEPARGPERAPQRPVPKAHPGRQTRVNRETKPSVKRKQRFMPKLLSVGAVFVAAAVLIFMIVRYAMITAEWAGVNALQADIAQRERRIAELEVQLEEAADLVAAKETALEAGLNYPAAEQIVGVGGAEGGEN